MLLDESDDGESSSDLELVQFDVSNIKSESSGSDSDVVTQLPTLSTSANPAMPADALSVTLPDSFWGQMRMSQLCGTSRN